MRRLALRCFTDTEPFAPLVANAGRPILTVTNAIALVYRDHDVADITIAQVAAVSRRRFWPAFI